METSPAHITCRLERQIKFKMSKLSNSKEQSHNQYDTRKQEYNIPELAKSHAVYLSAQVLWIE